MWVVMFSLLVAVCGEETATPSSLLEPRHYNYHAQYLKEVSPKPTKQGPVLFPNDGPPPPRNPLIVTSRPLLESIARSELNPNPPENNSIASSSQVNRVSFKPSFLNPGILRPNYYDSNDYIDSNPSFLESKLDFLSKPNFLAKVKDYKPFSFTPRPLEFRPYANILQKSRLNGPKDNRYSDYEEHTALPPIYKALADHANQKVQKIKHKALKHQNYQVKEHRHDHGSDYDEGSNYAFSYTVKDHNTGDDFSHSQQSSGSATNGEYRVRLPDGRMQIVSYTADENGYKADVRYDDEKIEGNSIDNYYQNRQNYNQNQRNYEQPKVNYEQSKPNYDYNYNYDNKKHKYEHAHDYGQNINDYAQNNDYTDVNHDYVPNRDYKPIEDKKFKIKEDFNQYSDISKEVTDYSAEYDGKHDNYEPHKSKFTSFLETKSTVAVPTVNPQRYVSSVKPSYEELKPLFVPRKLYNPQPSYDAVEINVPSTTPSPNFEGTTEHVVVIGTKPNLYTNIKNGAAGVTPTPYSFSPTSFLSPKNYLVSTIASLKKGEKPILSDSFINRINKYLSFN